MKKKFTQLRSRLMLLILSVGLATAGQQAWAKASMVDTEQAKLISKFAKHVSWPTDARQTKFIIGVFKDSEKYDFLSGYFKGKGVKGKDIIVRLVARTTNADDLNILYIPFSYASSLDTANDNLKGSNVLIVTENSPELHKSMIDISYNEAKTKVMFRINDARIDGTQLLIPNLSYFLDYKNNEKVLDASPTAAKDDAQKKKLSTLQKQLANKDAALKKANKKLQLSQKSSKKYKASLDKESSRLKLAWQDNDKKDKKLKSKDKKIKELDKKVISQRKQLSMNKKEWQVADGDKVEEQEKAIADLTEQLNKQKTLAQNAASKLAKAKDAGGPGIFFYVLILLTIGASAAAYLMWNKAKEAEENAGSAPSEGDVNPLLPARNEQLIKSENLAALGYIATDITYAVGLSLEELLASLESAGDSKNAATLKPVVTLLDTFNIIAAEQDDVDVQSFDVIAYMQKMVMLYEFEFSQSDITYDYSGESSLTIKSVPSYIALTLLHIINNALKHGFDNDGNGKLSLNVEKGAKGGAVITFADDGKGMSKSTLKAIFEPFVTTRSDRGYVGVGMSTAKDLITNKLSGDIKVDSQEGKGTTVIITLP